MGPFQRRYVSNPQTNVTHPSGTIYLSSTTATISRSIRSTWTKRPSPKSYPSPQAL